MLLETMFQLEMSGYKPILPIQNAINIYSLDKGLLGDLVDRKKFYFKFNLLSAYHALLRFYVSIYYFAVALLFVDEHLVIVVKFFGTWLHMYRYLDIAWNAS